jgi:hypothetical protein
MVTRLFIVGQNSILFHNDPATRPEAPLGVAFADLNIAFFAAFAALATRRTVFLRALCGLGDP